MAVPTVLPGKNTGRVGLFQTVAACDPMVTSLRRDGRFMRARSVNSTVHLTSGEVVAIELPRLSENDAAAFANHAFSIRVKSQRIR